MKKTILLFATGLIAVASISQSIQEEKVTFTSERLPLEPIADLDGYNFTVETPYAANNDQLRERAQQKFEEDKANYPNTVAEAEARHEQDMIQYEQDVITAQENFKLKSEEYDKLSAVEKIALKIDPPKLVLPRKPVYYKPSEPVYVEPNTSKIITFDPEVLAGSYLKLAGYEKSTSGRTLSGHVIVHDFESDTPLRRATTKTVYNSSTKSSSPVTTYHYITYYKQPTYVKVQLGSDILFEGIIESTVESDSIRTDKSPDMMSLEKKSVNQAVQAANEFINSKYGYSQIEREYEVRYEKNKKGEYDDLESAKDLALDSYKEFQGGKNNESLLKAIEIWKKAYSESDVEDRKARIDKKVTIAILQNLIDACLVTEQPAEALTYFNALKEIDLPYAVKISLDETENEIKDVKNRVDAKI